MSYICVFVVLSCKCVEEGWCSFDEDDNDDDETRAGTWPWRPQGGRQKDPRMRFGPNSWAVAFHPLPNHHHHHHHANDVDDDDSNHDDNDSDEDDDDNAPKLLSSCSSIHHHDQQRYCGFIMMSLPNIRPFIFMFF